MRLSRAEVLNECDTVRCWPAMDYREVEAPSAMQAIVKLAWSLTVPADGPAWIRHVATPDGCMEIIRRLSGRSRWGGEQPSGFVAGIITAPRHSNSALEVRSSRCASGHGPRGSSALCRQAT